MRFSIAKLIVATILFNIVVCLSFVTPAYIGFPILTFLSLIVIPPAMIVGAVNTRGARQAFFLGCMIAGVAHYIVSIYIFVMFAFDYSSLSNIEDPFGYIHIVGYGLGLMGGLSGVGMYHLIQIGKQNEEAEEAKKLSAKPNPLAPLHEEIGAVGTVGVGMGTAEHGAEVEANGAPFKSGSPR